METADNPNIKLKLLTLSVYEGLRIFINVHDYIFRESFTFMSFVRDIFGKAVSLSVLCKEAERLIPVWDAIGEDLKEFSSCNYPSLSQDEKEYFEVLSNFVNAVRKSIDALVSRQRLMEKWSRSFFKNPISWKVFKEKEKQYIASIKEYQKIGLQLDDLNHIFIN
ncbi:MAG: hypothetical protein K0B37_10880 [Bacteroidales bacterium]|nr:hypothetical protein [Bacteroidales bacterium]